MLPIAIAILGSGKGSNCRAILEEIVAGRLAVECKVVISDVQNAGILEIAREFDISTLVLPKGKYRSRLEDETEAELVARLRELKVDLIVLAGFMRVLKATLLNAFPRRIINIHPSLLPRFPGREAWAQALASGVEVTGCTVHYVDAGVDTGEIIARREVPILPNDSPTTLHARIQVAERELFPEVIGQLAGRRR